MKEGVSESRSLPNWRNEQPGFWQTAAAITKLSILTGELNLDELGALAVDREGASEFLLQHDLSDILGPGSVVRQYFSRSTEYWLESGVIHQPPIVEEVWWVREQTKGND